MYKQPRGAIPTAALLQGTDSSAIAAAVLVTAGAGDLSEPSCWTLNHSRAESAFLHTEGGRESWRWAWNLVKCRVFLSRFSLDTSAR